MTNLFFEKPILNSPCGYPARYWELDKTGRPTEEIIEKHAPAEFVTPIPKPKKQKGAQQEALLFDEVLSSQAQQYHSAIINSVRTEVDKWRGFKNPNDWRVTPETARLLQHWRHSEFGGVRPLFCQVQERSVATDSPVSGKWVAKCAKGHFVGVNKMVSDRKSEPIIG